jgi:LysM domain
MSVDPAMPLMTSSGTHRAASDQTEQQLQDRNPGFRCSALKAGDLLCTADQLAFCENKAKVGPGDTCATAAAANGLTVNQLLGFNRQLSIADCANLIDQDVCLPSPPPEAVSHRAHLQCAQPPASTACKRNGVSQDDTTS